MDENLKNGAEAPEQAIAPGEKVILADLEQEMKRRFLEYSVSVLVARALPDVRDGLKPVHRRILYTMHENNLTPDKAYRKCADTVGTVLGRYHPHGDASVYDAMVRMAQDFSLRYPLIDGHGNFGSIDGHPAAAYRYTESRMNRMSLDMLVDIDKNTVDFVPNYDDRLKEPVVLPSRFPNLLVNGSSGIAVGMATNIPPHNLCEVVDAICMLIDNPEADLPELMEHIKGPDFPTGGVIMGRAGIRAAYATGRGRITVRARTEITEETGGHFRITVTEIPYMVRKLDLVKNIVELVDEKRIEGIRDVVDYSNRNGMRIVIELKKDANPQIVLNHLYRYTQMQTTFGAIMLALVNGEPRVLTLKQMLEEYIKYQVEVITRRTQYELKKAQEKAHIWEALKVAVDFIDEVINIIRKSPDQAGAKAALCDRFGFDDVQADAIVKMRLGQLSGLGRQEIEDELNALHAKIAGYLDLLADEVKIRAVVKEECLRMRDKYGDERRTDISIISGEMDIEDLIPVEESVLTMTRLGYIKRMAADVYKAQHRGGRGITGMTTRDEDVTETLFRCSSHDMVLFFTSTGRVYRLKGYEVPEGSRTAKGMNIVNLLPLEQGEKVTAMIPVNEFLDDQYLTLLTRQGIIKRTRLSAYSNARKSGLIAIDLDEGDSLVGVAVTDGYQDMLVATKKGMAIRFSEANARVIGRTARGVKALNLAADDEVIALVTLEPGKMLLTVTETGYGRLSYYDNYRLQGRGGKGLTNYHTEKFGDVAAVIAIDPEQEDIMLISTDGIVIRMHASDIRVCNRPSKGVRVMRLDEGVRIVSLVTTTRAADDEEELAKPEDTGDADEGAEDTPSDRDNTLKVLAIGNSFSLDSMDQLWKMFHSTGYESVVLGNLVIGGCYLDKHYDNIVNDIAAYEYWYNDNNRWVVTENANLLEKLKSEDWDIISIQQVSQDSGRPETFGNLQNIIDFLKANEIGNAKIYWNMTWAYQQDTEHGGFANYNKDQMTMYNAIVNTVQTTILPNEQISGLFAPGTTIQNLRTALGDILTRDGFHLSLDIGRYAAALTWYCTITGNKASTVKWMPADTSEAITPYLDVIHAAVDAALANPYEITDLS